MASILCKFHIALVVFGVSVILIEPSESFIDFKLLKAILSNSKCLSTIFCFKPEQETLFKSPNHISTEQKVDPEGNIQRQDSKPAAFTEDSNEEDSSQVLEEVRDVNLIDGKEDLNTLVSDYENSPNFYAKFVALQGEFSHMRGVAGDGNCFFRSFAFGYFEYLLNHSQEIANFKILVRKLKDELFNWFDSNNIEKMHKMFEEVITVTESGNSESLYKMFNLINYSNNVVHYLRFITSGEMRKNEDFYKNFVFDDFTIDKFCSEKVETMNKFSDSIHIMALSKALKINVQVASIDNSPSPKPMIAKFPEENRPCCVHLLHTPGHYSILYSKTDEACN